ncbi:tetratricopeptide repeat protein [Glycocaulis abyssi]|uniref:Tetratricopeptide repeat protein n=1 Tax=Glycocaulis abyssi TaxID=1433403 RepID=A0ABV9NFN7_9PROT
MLTLSRALVLLALSCLAAPVFAQPSGGNPQGAAACPEASEAMAAGNAEDAVAALRACLSARLHPWQTEAELRVRLGASQLALGESEAALFTYNQVIALLRDNGGNTDIPIVRRNRAVALFQLDRLEEALADLLIAERGMAQDDFVHILLGGVYMELDRGTEAIAAYDNAIRLAPDSPGGWIGRSAAFIELDLMDRAVEDGREAVAIAPDDGSALNALCWALVKAQRASEGMDICYAAVEAEPDSGAIIHSLAAALEQIGEHEEAYPLFARAFELEPDNSTIADDYARVSAASGD